MIQKLLNGEALFVKFWNIPKYNSVYRTTRLLGNKEGISGSSISGYNIAINNYISDDRKKQAIEALKFITSEKMQKKCIIEGHIFTAINSLYDDRDVCQVIDCELIKNLQSFIHSYDADYHIQFKKYIYDFLFENKTIAETVNKIDDITKFYYISINPNISVEGLIIFIIIISLIVVMLFSLSFLFTKKYKPYFKFLSTDLWIINMLGNLLYLTSLILQYGYTTSLKCRFYFLMISLSVTLSNIPILYKLISIFPKENKNLEWIKNHKYLFISFFISIDILLNLIYLKSPYEVKEHYIPYGKNYKNCSFNSFNEMVVLLIIYIEKVLIIITINLFIFMEWNIKSSKKDVKLIFSAVSIYTLLLIIYMVIPAITLDNYVISFLFYSITGIVYSVTNFIFIYGIRIIKFGDNKDSEKHKFFRKAMNEFKSTSLNNNNFDTTTDTNENSINNKNTTLISKRRPSYIPNRRESLLVKMVYIHYNPENESEIKTNETNASSNISDLTF